MMAAWHPKCFTCEMCHKELADLGFIKNQGKAIILFFSKLNKIYKISIDLLIDFVQFFSILINV